MKISITGLILLGVLFFSFRAQSQITLTEPDNGYRFASRSFMVFKWDQNFGDGVARTYHFRVKKVLEDQTLEEAYASNDTEYYHQSSQTTFDYEWSHQIGVILDYQEKYVWKVEAEVDGIADSQESPLNFFFTPWVTSAFYAEGHKTTIDTLYNKDINQLSGKGQIRLTSDSDLWTPYEFENVNLKDNGGYYIVESGAIDIVQSTEATLTAIRDNSIANVFTIEKYIIDPSGLNAKASGSLIIPHLSGEKTVNSTIEMASFDDFTINGHSPIENINIEIQPGFNYQCGDNLAYFNSNRYWFSFSGSLDFHVDTSIPIQGEENLSFINIDRNETAQSKLVDNTQLMVTIVEGVIDFSAEQSDDHFNDPEWKGVWVEEFDFSIPADQYDANNQVLFHSSFSKSYSLAEGDLLTFLPSGQLEIALSEEMSSQPLEDQWYHYMATFEKLEINSSKNGFENSQLTGEAIIPYFSEDPLPIKIEITEAGYAAGSVTFEGEEITVSAPFIETAKSIFSGYQLTWFPIEAVQDYKLYVSQDDFASFVGTYDGMSIQDTVVLITDLNYNETYQVKIAGGDNVSNIINITPQQVPEAPTNIQTLLLDDGSVSITWTDNSEIEDGFIIEKLAVDEFDNSEKFEEIGSVAANVVSFIDPSTDNFQDDENTYRIYAFNTGGSSDLVTATIVNEVLSLDADKANRLVFYPNPYINSIYANISGNSSDLLQYKYQLIDPAGKIILSGHSNIESMTKSISINSIDEKPGIYFLHLHRSGTNKEVYKLVKK